MGKPKNPRYFRPVVVDKRTRETIRRTYLGQCEVAGCAGRAVAYHESAMWRLCAKHSALLAQRSGERGDRAADNRARGNA